MEPIWLFKLTVFCVEWVKAGVGAALVIWWFGGLLFIHDFFGQHSPIIPWMVSLLHSCLLYLLAQFNVRLFDLIGFGATQDGWHPIEVLGPESHGRFLSETPVLLLGRG